MNEAEILNLHRASVVFLAYVNPWLEYAPTGVSARCYFTESAKWMEASIPMMRKGGADLVVLSHGNPDRKRLPGAAGVECMLKCFDAIIREIDANSDLVLVLTKGDLDHVLKTGKMGIILHITGAPFNGDLANLRSFFRIGVRSAHPFLDDVSVGGFADGPKGPKDLGLRRFGREIISEMQRLGMIVDLAHSSNRTFADVVRFAQRKPLIDSHTNCRSIADYDRCCSDQQLRAIAKTGGVVGAHFGFIEKASKLVERKGRLQMRAFHRKLRAMQRKYKNPYEYLKHSNDPFEWPRAIGGAIDDGTEIHRATISQLVDHIEHMVKVAGVDHVGIGSDYSSGSMPEGVETAETLVNLTRELVRRGFDTRAIKKIWGGNVVRVFRECLPT